MSDSSKTALTGHQVVIAGGGPTGLMLAAELALAGVDAAIVERRPDQNLPGSRAGGLHSGTLEAFDRRGIADRFISEGQVAQIGQFAGVSFSIDDFPTRHPYSLGLWQNHIERILADWVEEFPVTFYRGREVTGFEQDPSGVAVELDDGRTLRGEYLVGCDGGRSVVRKLAGIDFPGWDETSSSLIAEAEFAEEAEWGTTHDDLGVHGIGRVDYEMKDGEIVWADSGPVRIMVTEKDVGKGAEPSLEELSKGLIAVYGTDFGVHSPTWISRFTDAARQAESYRDRRVLLAGDAAHIHSPDGAQGLQTGVQDAANLGWKLAQVINGTTPDSLLDSYQDERHPVGARVLRNTMAHVALRRPDARTGALREVIAEMLEAEEARRRIAAMTFGLDIHYDFGEGHPLLGRRMPDLDLVTDEGPLRAFELLREARPVLINLGPTGSIDITGWKGRVQSIDAEFTDTWELPVIGTVDSPAAVLVRPDGYVAWVGEGSDAGLTEALTTWFGPAS